MWRLLLNLTVAASLLWHGSFGCAGMCLVQGVSPVSLERDNLAPPAHGHPDNMFHPHIHASGALSATGHKHDHGPLALHSPRCGCSRQESCSLCDGHTHDVPAGDHSHAEQCYAADWLPALWPAQVTADRTPNFFAGPLAADDLAPASGLHGHRWHVGESPPEPPVRWHLLCRILLI